MCLTATAFSAALFSVDISQETLACTTLSGLREQGAVNLERSLTLQTPLGGHLVSGHVDGVGTVLSKAIDGEGVRFIIGLPKELERYVARKGSICLDGVSLTVNQVQDGCCSVMIIPHTLRHTTLQFWREKTLVNIEVDSVARYLERLLQFS